ncbi:NUDIX domain-containing protein [Nocardia sp. NPDC052112]|uniref:NUDIX domain-containing protein n=1 Tax=Nocardia sp. NPDC052112 TaxID=3155646 RepID=UPI0034346B05
MTDTTTALAQVAKPQRHKVTGDVHLLLRRGSEVLFGQRRNTGFEDGAWHLPSGHLEADESVVDALIREAREEIGVAIAPITARFEAGHGQWNGIHRVELREIRSGASRFAAPSMVLVVSS